MAKITIERFAQDLTDALGARLVSLVLFGSAARAAAPGTQADTLLICDVADDDLFERLASLVAGWTRAGHPPPLILSEAEWRASADAFPIEYQDMRHHHRVVAGRDPWPGITVDRDHVRRQLEHELMGKLVRLRQAYAALRADPKRLGSALAASVAGFMTMLRATLRLAGREAPAEPGDLVRQAAALAGWNPDDLAALVAHARGTAPLKLRRGDPLPGAYLAVLARTADFVNRLT